MLLLEPLLGIGFSQPRQTHNDLDSIVRDVHHAIVHGFLGTKFREMLGHKIVIVAHGYG